MHRADVYGDHVPDYIFLVAECQNDHGGENWFVDGEAVLARLRAHPRADALLSLLTTIPFDQTESTANGGYIQGRYSEGPLFERRDDGRLRWKRMIGPQSGEGGEIPRSCWAVTPQTLEAAAAVAAAVDDDTLTPEELVEAVDAAIYAEQEIAGRVRLEQGEAVLVDNYRKLHSNQRDLLYACYIWIGYCCFWLLTLPYRTESSPHEC
jgi:alpha-ketoglutarate-dependent taurine dioxygenase